MVHEKLAFCDGIGFRAENEKAGWNVSYVRPPFSYLQHMKKLAKALFLLVTGVILAGYAILGPALHLFGSRTMGTVTDVRRYGGDRGEAIRNRYNYGVGFHFYLPDGKKIEGATNVVGNSYNSGLPKGPTPVLYLPSLPRVNSLEKQAGFSFEHLILLAVGIFFIRITVQSERNNTKTNKKR